jgi:pyruvate formate lyase activating enzyme
MDFSGLEKLSLVDYDDNITCTLFVGGCNFRCPFCQNSGLVLHPKEQPTIPWEDITEYLSKRRNVLDAVCVTGGEPTLMPDLLDKLKDIKAFGYKVKLDTNGYRPDVLKKAVSSGLVDYVAMDIKNSPEKYAKTVGLSAMNIGHIEESASFLIHGSLPYEFRTTVMEEFHTEGDFEKIGAWLEGAKKYFIQMYKDSENCIEHGFHMVSKEKALVFKAILSKSVEYVALRGYD